VNRPSAAGCLARPPRSVFGGASAPEILGGHLPHVEERDVGGTIRFPDRESVLAYVASAVTPFRTGEVPEFSTPFVVRRRPVVHVATK
jgi:hypothetical protein